MLICKKNMDIRNLWSLKNKKDWCFSVLFSLFFISLFSLSTTPFFYYTSLDSEIFQNIGMAILRGKIPYVDLFDHKGCILFFINAICIYINKTWGLWIVQCLYLCINVYLWIQIIKLLCIDKFSRLNVGIVLFFVLQSYFGEGNLSEEWSLFFIGLPVFISVKALSKHTLLSSGQLFIIGLCIGIVVFIRPNNILLIFGYLLFFLLLAVKEKAYAYIWKGVFLIFLGVLIPTMFCVSFFYVKAGAIGVEELLFGTFGFNIEYMNKYNSAAPLSLQFKILSYAPIVMMILLSLFCLKKHKEQVTPLVCSYGIGLLFVGQTLFRHYFLVFVPLIVVTWGLLYSLKFANLFKIIFLITFVGASINPLRRYMEYFYRGGNALVAMRCEQFRGILQKIPVEQRDDIWNYNGQEVMDAIVDADMVQCNRIIIPFHLNISGKLADEERNKIVRKQPIWILVNRKYVIDDVVDREFLEKFYIPVDSTHVKGMENVILMRRKY